MIDVFVKYHDGGTTVRKSCRKVGRRKVNVTDADNDLFGSPVADRSRISYGSRKVRKEEDT